MGPGAPICGSIPPLTGWRVGVTAHRRADEQAELLRRRGAAVVLGPVVRTLPFGDDRPLREATEALLARPPQLVIATTGIGIRSWFGAAESWGIDGELTRALDPARRVARGPKARAALAAVGLPSHADEPSERLDHLVGGLLARGVGGTRIALQLYGEALPGVIERLRGAGADVVAVPIYSWTAAEDLRPARRLVEDVVGGRVDAVTFTSSAAVRSFAALADDLGVGADLRDILSSRVLAACVGPITGEMAETVGFVHGCVPDRGRLGLLVRELSTELHGRHRHLRTADREVAVHGASVWSEGEHVLLTDLDRLLFAVFAADRPGVVVSRRALRQRIWGQQCGESAIDSAVSRLRRVLQPVGLTIDTVHRRGWALGATAAPCPALPDPLDALVG
jgi:uroporphyrinogen-III synthase